MNNPFDVIETRLDKIEALLLEIKSTPTNVAAEIGSNEILTVQEAAKFLSLKVPSVYGLIRRKELPVMKRSKRCYFLRADLIAYLKQGKQLTSAEAGAAAAEYLRDKRK